MPALHHHLVRPAVGHGGAAGVRRRFQGARLVTNRRMREPTLTVGDRLITALMGFVVAFLTMCVIWFLTLRIWFEATDNPPPFHWTWIVGLMAGAVGFVIGPERMMDGVGTVWRAIGALFFRPNRFWP
jgi:hypothetical protein